MAQFLWYGCTFKKQCTVPVTLTVRPMKVNFFLWIANNPISILYQFKIDISSSSRAIKYQNIGRTTQIHTHTNTQTDRQTHRQTGWKQYLATPSGGEVIMFHHVLKIYIVKLCENVILWEIMTSVYMLIKCLITYIRMMRKFPDVHHLLQWSIHNCVKA